MSKKEDKNSAYINVSADINFLQHVMCCNNDMFKKNEADSPRATSTPSQIVLTKNNSENIAIEEEYYEAKDHGNDNIQNFK